MEMLQIISPIITGALVLIMFGMGTSLEVGDFQRIWVEPRSVLTGLFNQLLLLPLLGMLFLLLTDLSVQMSLGFAIVVACPAGSLSNLFSHIGRLDTALSVSLTALSTGLAAITLPLWLQLALFLLEGRAAELPVIPLGPTILQVVLTTVLPVLVGIAFRHRFPEAAQKVDRWARIFSIGFLSVIIIGATTRDPTALVLYWNSLLPLFVLLNLSTMAVGFFSAHLVGLKREQALTIMLETGIQNVPLAISITVLILQTEEAAFIPPIYGVAMMVNGAFFLLWRWRRRLSAERNTP